MGEATRSLLSTGEVMSTQRSTATPLGTGKVAASCSSIIVVVVVVVVENVFGLVPLDFFRLLFCFFLEEEMDGAIAQSSAGVDGRGTTASSAQVSLEVPRWLGR